MVKKILYIGNKLSKKDRNLTTVETLSKELVALSYNVKSYSNKNNKTARLIDMLSAIIRHRDFDFVLIDTYSTSAFWYAWACAKLCRTLNLKYIMLLHGGNLPYRLVNNEKRCRVMFNKALINITPSHYLFEKFQNEGYSNLKIIPNSINIDSYKFKLRSSIQPRLLWVRAFAELYNPILALKVLKKLREFYPNAKLSMVGPFKDNSINECQAFAKEHELPVEFTGRLSKQKWIDYSKAFDIFINTTNVDNTPVSVIEALALGFPVVSTDAGGLPYLLENYQNAILVPPRDVDKMFDAIIELIGKPDLTHKLSHNGRKLAESFNWEVVKEKWKAILK